MAPYPGIGRGPDLRQLVLGSGGSASASSPSPCCGPRPTPSRGRMDAWAPPDWPGGRRPSGRSCRRRPGLLAPAALHAAETRTLLAFAERPAQTRALGAYVRCAAPLPADWVLRPDRCCRSAAHGQAARGRGHGRSSAPTAASAFPVLAAAWSRTRFRCAVPAQRPVVGGLRVGHTRARARTGRTCPACSPASRRLPPRALAAVGRARPRVHAPLAPLSVGLQPSTSRTSSGWRRPRRDAGALARAQDARQPRRSARGATISHHHGVGVDHAPYLAAEGATRDGRPRGRRPHLRPRRPDEPRRPAGGAGRDAADRVLALDVGTQSVRAMVFDPAGNLVARARVPIEPYVSPRPAAASRTPTSTGGRDGRGRRALCGPTPGVRRDADRRRRR